MRFAKTLKNSSFFICCISLASAQAATTTTSANPYAPYVLRAEWQGPCVKSDTVDVNLGNAPEVFVRAASCQISGAEPSAATVTALAEQLRTDATARRIDVVTALCKQAGRVCDTQLTYSDPWVNEPFPVKAACTKRYKRDVGAVDMFFFACPGKTTGGGNCAANWANNHVPGMQQPSPSLAWYDNPVGYYNPTNPGFWNVQLEGAKAAGLQFLLLNVFGPDMRENGRLDPLVEVLQKKKDNTVKIGMVDDTTSWGKPYYSDFWKQSPNLADTENTARLLYQTKWKPFFTKIPRGSVYLIKGHPVIYFYNGSALTPLNKSAAVIARMKQMFAADFGVTPYVAVGDAFFADPAMAKVADTAFHWDTFSNSFTSADNTISTQQGLSISPMNGRVTTGGFPRWDSRGRDAMEGSTRFFSRMIKNDQHLLNMLNRTHDADVLVLQTWNDLGEGTGVNEAYDYYFKGQWQRPDYFINEIRADNCTN